MDQRARLVSFDRYGSEGRPVSGRGVAAICRTAVRIRPMTASARSRPATAVEPVPTADPPGFTGESTGICREGGILTLRGEEGQDLPLEAESRAGRLANQGVLFRSDSRRDA